MTDRPEHPAPDTPWWRRPIGLVRRWLFSGGCSVCGSHDNDVDRWKRELDEQRGESAAQGKDARDG